MIRRRPSRFSRFRPLSKKKANRPTADGHVFDSGPEYQEYLKLKQLQDRGEIINLEVHPMYRFIINEINCGRFHADFRYIEVATGKMRVLDIKAWAINKKTGRREPIVDSDYKLRTNLVLALYGVKIETV